MEVCPACGEPVGEGARFCPACGHALAEVAAREERKVVSIVTTVAAGLAPDRAERYRAAVPLRRWRTTASRPAFQPPANNA